MDALVGRSAVKRVDGVGVGLYVIEGMAIPFGGPVRGRDLQGEAFSARTDFALGWFAERPLLYQHGMDPGVKAVAIGKQVSAEQRPGGIWAQCQLDQSNAYFREIAALVEGGKMFFSSGTLVHLIEMEPGGMIKRWPWIETSLTPTPANPYAMVDVAATEAQFQSVGLKFYVPDVPEVRLESGDREGGQVVTQQAVGSAAAVKPGVSGMTAAAVKALVADALQADRLAAAAAVQAEKDLQARIEARARELAGDMVRGRKIMMPTVRGVRDRALDADGVEALDVALTYILCCKGRVDEDTGALVKGRAFKSERLLKAMAIKAFAAQAKGELGMKALSRLGIKSDEVMHSDLTTYGDEWVPDLWSAAMWRKVRLQAVVLPLFATWEMPSNPAIYPIESSGFTLYKVAETADESTLPIGSQNTGDSTVTTAKLTFTAGKLGALGYFSEELVEDSIVPIVPQLRGQMVDDLAHGADEVLLSGDETTGSTNISYYGAGIGSTSRFLVLDGLRHNCLVTQTANKRDGGTLAIEDITATRKLMGTNGKYGVDPSKLVLIPCLGAYYKFLDLAELITVDKYGNQATLVTGEVGRVAGIPVVQTEDYGATDASGNIDETAGDNVKGSFMIARRDGIRVGFRRHVRVTVGDVPYSDAHYIIGSLRFDVQFFDTDMVGMTYNLTV